MKLLHAILLMAMACKVAGQQTVYTVRPGGYLTAWDLASCTPTYYPVPTFNFYDIAYDPSSGELYGVTDLDEFGIIDQSTAVFTPVSPIPDGLNALLTIGPGVLLAAADQNDTLYTIDASTGVATAIGSMGTGLGSAGDLAYYLGQIYLTTNTDQVVLVDPVSPGNSVVLGPINGATEVFGLFSFSECADTMYATTENDIMMMDMTTFTLTPVCPGTIQGQIQGATAIPIAGGGGSVQAAFVPDMTVPCAPTNVDFDNTGSGVSWLWDFGDLSPSSTAFEPSHTFVSPGTYTITLIAYDPSACITSDTSQQTITVGGAAGITAFTVVPASPCADLSAVINATISGTNLLLEWDMGNGVSLSGPLNGYTYLLAGSYAITLSVTDTVCGGTAQASAIVQVGMGLSVSLGPDTTLCPSGLLEINTGLPGASHLWNTGATSPTLSLGPGMWWVTVEENGCMGSDTIVIVENAIPSAIDPPLLCPGESTVLTVPAGSYDVLWAQGSNAPALVVDEAGEYPFTATSAGGCPYADTVRVVLNGTAGILFAPNAFTPNGDGINDVFAVVGVAEEISLLIHDRWGEEVFAGDQPIWDGTYKGAEPKEDIYIYTLSYHAQCGTGRTKVIGHVTLLR